MNDQEKITPAQISESQENLKAKYELDIEAAQQANLGLKKTLTDKDDEIFELQKQNKMLANEVEEWKTEARRNRRIEQAKQATKSQNDFKTEYIKLQEQKGWKWDEMKGWVK
jgi:hypothetical protein